MKLEENFEEIEQTKKGNSMMLTAVLTVSICIALVIGLVLFMNWETIFPDNKPVQTVTDQESGPDMDDLISGNKLVSGDLDIWEDYMEEEKEEDSQVWYEEKPSEDDPSEGGTKTLIEYANGTSEWVEVSPYLPLNDYDNAGFAMLDGRIAYYEDGAKLSYTGVDVSKYQGYVDFNAVKRDGIDYVMLRLGQRGYSTGQLVLDDYFSDNMKRATDAGLPVGVTFFSQAVNVEEAEEEAEFVLEHLEGQTVRFPVVFDMQHIENDSARIDILTKEEKTQIAKAFLSKIEAAGYIGMIHADKPWMFDDINYSAVSNYGIWLEQIKDLPDYPYRFQMWKYTNVGAVDGIEGSVSLSISFVDYTIK
ncbi:MAG: lysozyme [Lachnospiraceae bacterium]|nr:lysozyme [Lachnospiraceae bacterium]